MAHGHSRNYTTLTDATIVRQAKLNMADMLSGKPSGWSDRRFLRLLLGT